MVASTPTGPVMRPTTSDVALHGRHLNEVAASTVGEFTAAVGNSAVDKILLAAGTYELTSNMCTGSAVCISRTGRRSIFTQEPWDYMPATCFTHNGARG